MKYHLAHDLVELDSIAASLPFGGDDRPFGVAGRVGWLATSQLESICRELRLPFHPADCGVDAFCGT
jgi:hypothetical protein